MASRFISSIFLRRAQVKYNRAPVCPVRPTHLSGGSNLEIFKFGMYMMFPIGWMLYFGINLSERFDVPEFWPTAEQTNKIPHEREDQLALRDRLRERRLENRRRRMEVETATMRGDVAEEERV